MYVRNMNESDVKPQHAFESTKIIFYIIQHTSISYNRSSREIA